jgi:hypothetical protein
MRTAQGKEKKNYAGSKTFPASINENETMARSAVSLPHQTRKSYCFAVAL